MRYMEEGEKALHMYVRIRRGMYDETIPYRLGEYPQLALIQERIDTNCYILSVTEGQR